MLIVFESFIFLFDFVLVFLPGSQVIPTLKLIGVGGLLPRMIFHRLEPMFEYPREMGFPYIYIYCLSISRVFSCFLTFFARFWILSIFCVVSPGKSLFFDDRPISRVYLNFLFDFPDNMEIV